MRRNPHPGRKAARSVLCEMRCQSPPGSSAPARFLASPASPSFFLRLRQFPRPFSLARCDTIPIFPEQRREGRGLGNFRAAVVGEETEREGGGERRKESVRENESARGWRAHLAFLPCPFPNRAPSRPPRLTQPQRARRKGRKKNPKGKGEGIRKTGYMGQIGITSIRIHR